MEPTSHSQALSHPHWLAATEQEFIALQNNNTWPLVSLPMGHKAIGRKWVFKVKENPDGTINEYKTRLEAKGSHQQQGLDFLETFSPVIKPITVRCILTIVVSK